MNFCSIANKISYATKADASVQARRRMTTAKSRLHAYHCHHCDGYHLSKMRTKDPEKPTNYRPKAERLPCGECDRRQECIRAATCLEPYADDEAS